MITRSMTRSLASALALAVLLLAAPSAAAQNTSHNVGVSVATTNAFNVDASDVSIAFGAIPAGNQTASGAGSSSYDLTTNTDGAKIAASLDSDYPAGITLQALLGTPTASGATGASGGTSTQQTLSDSNVDLVTGISFASGSSISIDYTATITPAVAAGTYTRAVTYTYTAGS